MLLRLRVLPRSSKNEVVGEAGNKVLTIKVRAAPTDGKANEAVLEVLASHLKVPKNKLRLVRGHKSKNKIVEILD